MVPLTCCMPLVKAGLSLLPWDTPCASLAIACLLRCLVAEQVRMLLPRKRLRPRTYRLGEGQSLLLGGCARVDVVASPGATLYLTVWASDDVICHLGRTDSAEERCAHAHGPMKALQHGHASATWKLAVVVLHAPAEHIVAMRDASAILKDGV